MSSFQFINAIVEQEWKLKIEEEKRRNLKGEPFSDITTTPQPGKEQRRAILKGVVQHSKASQSVDCCYDYDQCREVKVG